MSRILFSVQLPPPVHGVSMINHEIKYSQRINKAFACEYINIAAARTVSNIGERNFSKYFNFLKISFSIFAKCVIKRYALGYITLAPVGLGFWRDSVYILLLKLFGIQCIFHLHGKGIRNAISKSKFKKAWYNHIFKNVIVIHLSEFLKKDLEGIDTYKEIKILPNGIKDHGIVTTKKKERGAVLKILYISNMIPSKGPYELLEALALLSEEKINFKAEFIGDWHSEDFKRKCTSFVNDNDLSDRITFLGPRFNEDKHRHFANADIFVLPTYFPNECFPLAILEAFSFGLPVISTFEGAIPEIVREGENGFLVESKSTAPLAEKIKFFAEDPASLTKMGQQAREDYVNNYTFEKFEKRFIEILKRL